MIAVIGKAKPYRGFTRMSADRKEIAEIAGIARNRRNRKGKTLPLMNADQKDRVIARDRVIR